MIYFTKTFMFINPLTLFFGFMVFTTSILIMSTNSWFIAWIILEINLLSFIPLIFFKKNKLSSEATLKYFLVQAFTSVLIIFGVMNSYLFSFHSIFLLLFALMVKMALAPCHQWLPSMIEGLNWPNIFLILTLQKIGPLVLTLNPLFLYDCSFILYPFIMFSALIGAAGGLSQSNLNKIMVYSSIAHMAWLIMALSLNNYMWIMYFSIYSIILFSILLMFHYLQVYKISHLFVKMNKKTSLVLSVSILSLGGLPPFSGFVPKLIVTQELFMRSYSMIFLLLFSTFLSLFFYIRMFLPNMLNTSISLNLKPFNQSKQEMLILFNSVILIIFPFYFIII